jgi:hypothetical protein
MRKLLIATVATGLLAGSGPASAKEKIDPRIGAAIACTNIAQNDERLRCFDQALTGLKQALASGQLIPADDAKKPLVLEGTVKSAGHFGFNRFWVELDSGDRWELEWTNRFDQVPPKRGTKVTIKRAAIGGYWVKEVGGSNRRASYLGRRSN